MTRRGAQKASPSWAPGETALSTLYVTHPSAVEHVVPTGHPERPARMQAVERALEDERFAALVRCHAPRAEASVAELVHPASYVETIVAASPDEGFFQIDGDTLMSPGSLNTCLHAIGGSNHAVDAVMKGECANAFVAMRPPGHHAERDRAMGFCLFNHAAIAVRHAQKAFGATRVALVDFDVHHGNGTQDIFYASDRVYYASIHGEPDWAYPPHSGFADETGTGAGEGATYNQPLPVGTGWREYSHALDRAFDRLSKFDPSYLVVSQGFDTFAGDRWGGFELHAPDYARIGERLRAFGRPIVVILEGGYEPANIAAGTMSLLDGLG